MEDAEDTVAAMAQAMGFSSFGAQNNSKRRKFNPRADAVVASTSTSSLPLHGSSSLHEASSGSNALPLGVRTRNEDEIDLDGDGEGADVSSSGAHDGLENEDDDGPKPQYLDTSRSPTVAVADPSDEIQSKIDMIIGSSSGQVSEAQSSSFRTGEGIDSRGNHRGHQTNRRQGREPGKNWWEDYYDPSSNVNPWERLEKTKGLEPRGGWMTWEEAKR
ncbi:hypothetical protein GGR54DRAFT_624734 [Hypoxylon sp. NC1633]|nr:hypothetical protein GGR54DRAFT_624734 [Hypoxylon sp. NC1633]